MRIEQTQWESAVAARAAALAADAALRESSNRRFARNRSSRIAAIAEATVERAERTSRKSDDLAKLRRAWMKHQLHMTRAETHNLSVGDDEVNAFAPFEGISLREAARRKGVSPNTISQAIARGDMDAIKRPTAKGKLVARKVYVTPRFEKWTPQPTGRRKRDR